MLVYPSSNGYNSYMDRDEGPIGGIKNPLAPTRQLFYVSVIMDFIAILVSGLISSQFTIGILVYILASRAYSYRGIRVKKYPIWGYLLVCACQGALVFYLVYSGSTQNLTYSTPLLPAVASSFLIGGFYPLTQIYQHKSDKEDGVTTISFLLGYRGTFIFTGIVYAISFVMLGFTFFYNLEWLQFMVLQILMLPVIVYFFIWMRKVWKDETEANFKNTMKMNVIASSFTNLGFITVLIINQF